MRTLVVLLGALALVGCKTDKTNSTKPATGSAGSAVATGSGAGGSAAGSGSAAAAPKTGSAIKLPKSDGTPPRKTDKPIDQAVVDKLGKLDFEGFDKVDRTAGKAFEVRLSTPRPRLATTVTIAPCFDCIPMDLDQWKAKTDTLKVLLAEELRALPDTVFEVGKTELNGQTMIYTYQFGYQSMKEEHGPAGAFSNAYALYYNDGVNQIRVVAEYKDDWVAREDMTKIAPREDLEKLARAFMDAYTHAW